jgi:CheY-like chemotaxis protein
MKTLLLADDSVTIQRVIELTFAQEDVRVVSVNDGRRAVQWMDSEAPDIVLVDVAVPDMNGYAVATHVRQSPQLRHIPILLLAGAFEPVDEARAERIGCDGILVKPFEPQQLVSRVKALLADGASRRSRAGDDGVGRERASHDGDPSAVITPFPGTARPGMTAASGQSAPEPLEPPVRPVWDVGTATASLDRQEREPALPSRVSLANAFSALLAAEQLNPPAAPAPGQPVLSDAMVEEAVRKALVRMTDDVVRRIVVETAERMIREEIDKIKSNPE